ncbi:MAG: acyl carrier protein [Bacteroidales bacterium]|jgi:acyl carrier protein|nr:acyl carrier protein [Bacteroidales bacterium]
MTLNEFVKLVANEFSLTPADSFNPSTRYRELEEWGSLTALSVVDAIDDEMDVQITGATLRSVNTIEELYNLVMSKK